MLKNTSYIAQLARRLAGTNASNYKDNEIIGDINIVRHDMHDFIINNTRSHPFWDEAFVDLYENISEYNMPGADDDKPVEERYFSGFDRITKVFVKVGEAYKELEYKDIQSVSDNWENAREGYSIADNSIFIFPTPKENKDAGLKLHGVNRLRDIKIQATEQQIFGGRIPTNHFETLALGVALRYVRYYKRDFDEAMVLENSYNKEMEKLRKFFQSRSLRIVPRSRVPERKDLQ